MVSWCSWLSRQSNTLKVSGSNPGEAIFMKFVFWVGVQRIWCDPLSSHAAANWLIFTNRVLSQRANYVIL
ncbi:hypothetical protein MTR_8g063140 [Medicago truncatula]|uniref:Uncharacterized protein n=1 Tax=Medicago truncatula TaxID=3880 RepID=G7LFF4_MEDTR|nr:hypothetical protein MTR_8g063140 [Medicago truncatula]